MIPALRHEVKTSHQQEHWRSVLLRLFDWSCFFFLFLLALLWCTCQLVNQFAFISRLWFLLMDQFNLLLTGIQLTLQSHSKQNRPLLLHHHVIPRAHYSISPLPPPPPPSLSLFLFLFFFKVSNMIKPRLSILTTKCTISQLIECTQKWLIESELPGKLIYHYVLPKL